MMTVVAINGLLAGLVLALAYGLWLWRRGLIRLKMSLEAMSISPDQVGYAAVQQRLQLVETRFGLAKWQLRMRQVKQLLKLIKLLRTLLLYRAVQRRPQKSGR